MRQRFLLFVFLCIFSLYKLPAQEVFKRINYFNYQETEQSNIDWLYLLSKAQRGMRAYDSLIDTYLKMLGINDQLGEIYYLRGMLYAAVEKYPQACHDFGRALDLHYEEAGIVVNYYCSKQPDK